MFTGTEASRWRRVSAKADHSSGDYAVFVGDAKIRLGDIPDQSADTCITSPPYWGARDYSDPDQIGSEADVQQYVDNLVSVFSEVRRVLTETGTAWLNLGDTYFGNCGTVNGKPPAKGWKRNKQLSLVPFRVALALEEDGWWVRNAVCWHKPNAMPFSGQDRLSNTWEPVFLLAKAEQYYFNLDAIRIQHETSDEVERKRAERGGNNGKASGKASLRRWLNSPRHRATIDGLKEVRVRPDAPDSVVLASYLRQALHKNGVNIQWVADQLGEPFERTRHYFRTDPIGSRLPPEETWPKLKNLLGLGPEFDSAMSVVVKDNVFRNHPNGKNPGDYLCLAVAHGTTDHFAVMPLSLAEWTLKATLPAGGICLDPFMGTGTSGIAAIQAGGRFIGIDIDQKCAARFVDWCSSRSSTVKENGQNRSGHRPMKSNGR